MDKESNHRAYPAQRNFHAYDYRAKEGKVCRKIVALRAQRASESCISVSVKDTAKEKWQMGEENSTASISRTTFLFFSPLFSFDDVDDLQEELFSCSENCDLVTSEKTAHVNFGTHLQYSRDIIKEIIYCQRL